MGHDTGELGRFWFSLKMSFFICQALAPLLTLLSRLQPKYRHRQSAPPPPSASSPPPPALQRRSVRLRPSRLTRALAIHQSIYWLPVAAELLCLNLRQRNKTLGSHLHGQNRSGIFVKILPALVKLQSSKLDSCSAPWSWPYQLKMFDC